MVEKFVKWAKYKVVIVGGIVLFKFLYGLHLSILYHFAPIVFIILIGVMDQFVFEYSRWSVHHQSLMNYPIFCKMYLTFSEKPIVFIALPTTKMQNFIFEHKGSVKIIGICS